MPFYEKGDVRIRYEMVGSGFPMLVTPGGGLNSRVSNWPTAVFNAMEAFKDDFRCITMDQRNANRVRPDFVYSVSREFVRSCQTPLLVMPDDTPAHPYQTSVDIAALAPKAQSTVFPWREPKDLLEKTIDQVRAFLRSHQPVTAGR